MKIRMILAMVAGCGVVILFAQQRPAGPYTQDQAAAGRTIYQTNCVSCHSGDLSGQEGPQLAGANFLAQWGDRTAGELISFMQSTMPPGGAALPGDSYINLAAFILDANSARAGNQSADGRIQRDHSQRRESGQRAAYLQTGGGPAAVHAAQNNGKQGKQAKQAKQEKQTPRGITVEGEVKNYIPVTDAMLRNPDPADWLMIRRDYKASSFSTLNQIAAQNVNDLRLVWSWAMQDGSPLGNDPAPIVHNGVLYVNNAGEVLQALDAKTGDLIWENRYGTNAGAPAMRGITIYGDNVFVTSSEAHLIAFDARTGKIVWDTTIGDRSKNQHSTTSGPLAVKGKLIQGLSGCQTFGGEKCFISAYDAKTGKEVWRFYTVALEGEPGGDTWGGLPDSLRVGAESWITGSYDPDLNLTYWGTAQAKPWMRVSRGSGNGATLYANSTLALNADTGKLAWYYDHAPGETLDLDEVFERVLVDDQGQNYVFSAGKTGILWKLDRKTGKYLGHKEMVFQNVYDSFNPTTGEPHYRNDIVEQRIGEGVLGCPFHRRRQELAVDVVLSARQSADCAAEPELPRIQRAGGR